MPVILFQILQSVALTWWLLIFVVEMCDQVYSNVNPDVQYTSYNTTPRCLNVELDTACFLWFILSLCSSWSHFQCVYQCEAYEASMLWNCIFGMFVMMWAAGNWLHECVTSPGWLSRCTCRVTHKYIEVTQKASLILRWGTFNVDLNVCTLFSLSLKKNNNNKDIHNTHYSLNLVCSLCNSSLAVGQKNVTVTM